MSTDRIILGIDPGTQIMGYGIIHRKGKELNLITMGILNLKKIADHYSKLQRIFEKTLFLIDEYNPDEMAIEAPFYGKDIQAMLKLGRAQGVVMSAALSRSVPIFEYAPRKIKLAITGSGNATKEQVARMLINLLNIKEMPESYDATDGVATAVCHYFQNKTEIKGKIYSDWKSFLSDNPDRIGT